MSSNSKNNSIDNDEDDYDSSYEEDDDDTQFYRYNKINKEELAKKFLMKKHIQIMSKSTSSNLVPKSIIYEDPELTSSIEFSTTNGTFKKFKNKLTKGFIINSSLTFFSKSPIIFVIFSGYIFNQLGIIYSIIIYFLFAFTSFFTNMVLIKLKNNFNKCNNLIEILEKHFGKYFGKFYYINTFLYSFGINLIYFYIFYYIIHKYIIENLFINVDINNQNLIEKIIIIFALIFFEFSIIILKNYSNINYINIFNAFFLVTSSITNFFYNFSFKENLKEKISLKENNNLDLKIILSLIFISISNQNNFFNILNNMKIFTFRRGKKVAYLSIISQLFYYILIGIMILFSIKNYIKEDDLFYFENLYFYEQIKNDIYFIFEKIIICFICSFNIGYNSFNLIEILRTYNKNIKNEIFKKNEDNNNYFNIIETIYIILIIIFVNIFGYIIIKFNLINFIIGLTCSVFGVISCYIIPIYCFLTIYLNINQFSKIISIIIIIIMFLIAVYIFILSIKTL